MAAGAALFGTIVMFVGAWLNEKTREFFVVRGIVQFLAFLPMAVPGLVLGLGYIFFFNAPNQSAQLPSMPPWASWWSTRWRTSTRWAT